MSEMPILPPNPETNAEWEESVHRTASSFRYPPTPDIAGRLRTRAAARRTPFAMHLAQAAAVMLLIFAAVMAVPQVRAEVVRILQIGVIRILLDPTLTPTAAALATQGTVPKGIATATLLPTGDGTLTSVLQLPGETTLAEAEDQFGYTIPMPTHPAELGEPDRVYYLESGGSMVALVWLYPNEAASPLLSLFVFGPNSDVWKTGISSARELLIDGEHAIWTEDPHMSQFWTSEYGQIRRQVNDHVLIWFAQPLTYRLEGDFTLEEATKIMQSLE